MSEINVTPLVDVMLVLLIVFMVAAPLLTVGVPIDLPQSQAKSLNTDSKPITVSVTSAGDVYVLEDKIDPAELISTIQALIPEGTDERIYVRGDTVADYGSVMKVMGQLSGAGYTKIGLITEQEQGQ
ncbi:MAG: biopolymer transport protein TolR [Maritalea sp.]|jgi:biopolymer transport protein TolR